MEILCIILYLNFYLVSKHTHEWSSNGFTITQVGAKDILLPEEALIFCLDGGKWQFCFEICDVSGYKIRNGPLYSSSQPFWISITRENNFYQKPSRVTNSTIITPAKYFYYMVWCLCWWRHRTFFWKMLRGKRLTALQSHAQRLTPTSTGRIGTEEHVVLTKWSNSAYCTTNIRNSEICISGLPSLSFW